MGFIKEAISKIVNSENLSEGEARQTMIELIDGTATQSQIGSLLTALRFKGETVDEIAAFARVMKEHASRIEPRVASRLTDTCGTGGDKLKTFNISTLAALVISGAGAPVAKHGNRSFTSKCGSADLLEHLGVNINASPDHVKTSVEQAGIGFLFAPIFHSATKNVSVPRKEIGIRTVFNLLGPLTNPANAKAQLLGVYDDSLVVKMASVLGKLGIESALVVHGLDGFDEISLIGQTHVARLADGMVKQELVTPSSFGLEKRSFDAISSHECNIDDHATTALSILQGSVANEKEVAVRDMVLANASAGLVASGKASNFIEGIDLAKVSLESGRAFQKLNDLVRYSEGDKTRIESLLLAAQG